MDIVSDTVMAELAKYSAKMYKRLTIIFSVVFLLVVCFSVLSPTPVHASIIDNIKGLFTTGSSSTDKNVKNKNLTIDSSIKLAPGGDENNNNEIDSGDTVRFTYIISNNTSNDLKFATLKTNVQKEKINFIHNVSGVTGIKRDKKNIIFPNLRIHSGSQSVIRFDAQINYDDEDIDIDTEPEIVDSSNKSLAKSVNHTIKAKKLTLEEITERVKKRGLLKSNSTSTAPVTVTIEPTSNLSPTVTSE